MIKHALLEHGNNFFAVYHLKFQTVVIVRVMHVCYHLMMLPRAKEQF